MFFVYAFVFACLSWGVLLLTGAFGNAAMIISGFLAVGCLGAGLMMLWNKLKDIENKLDRVLKDQSAKNEK